MNREIKFRGKRIDNGEWVYGNLLELTHEEKSICYIIPSITNGSWSKEKLMLKFISPCFEVIPETVGQFTGERDKTDKEIYDDDIVNYPDAEMYYNETFVNTGYVDYDETTISFYFTNRETVNMQDIDIKNEVEIIGNIHDNVEIILGR